MSARRYGYIREEQRLQDPRREPSIDELVREYLGTVPPGAVPEVQAADEVVTPEAPQ